MTLDEATQPAPAKPPRDLQSIAPWWHTALLLAQLLFLALIGPSSARLRIDQPHLALYIASIMSQYLQLSAAVAGVYRRKKFFVDALQSACSTWRREILIGIALFIATMVMFGIVNGLLRVAGLHTSVDHEIIRSMAPTNARQLLLWLVVSVVVGFCEELVFRGYLLRQGVALMHRMGASRLLAQALSVVLTSVLFGSLHLYEGLSGAILIGLLGLVYSIVALSRGNLRAVIVAHVLQDSLAMVFIMLRHSHHA